MTFVVDPTHQTEPSGNYVRSAQWKQCEISSHFQPMFKQALVSSSKLWKLNFQKTQRKPKIYQELCEISFQRNTRKDLPQNTQYWETRSFTPENVSLKRFLTFSVIDPHLKHFNPSVSGLSRLVCLTDDPGPVHTKRQWTWKRHRRQQMGSHYVQKSRSEWSHWWLKVP